MSGITAMNFKAFVKQFTEAFFVFLRVRRADTE